MIGQTVAHYRIVEKLGEGGMGVVYKAEDTTLKRTVALKFLPRGVEAYEGERARFLQEAQAAAALNHPNICTIYDIQSHEVAPGEGPQQFIVMEFVDGRTLEQMVPIEKLQTAIGYAIQIGEALQEAHSKAIVHRDIKADNIMVNSKNQIKVMDFGLAKLKGSLKLTKTSSTVGTLAYMAPEQIEGGEVDARSDIFSFGIVLYQMLTGHMPFRGAHEAAMVYSIVNEDPTPLQKYMPEVPSELVHILNRALEKDPADRYQNVSEMVIDLRRLKKQSAPVSRATRTVQPPEEHPEGAAALPLPGPGLTRKRILPVLLVAALLVVAAGAAVLLLSRGKQLNPDMKFRIVQVPFEDVWYADVSTDGNWLYFPAADDNGKFDVYMMNMAGGAPRRITSDSCQGIFGVVISPDGSTILYDRIDPEGRNPEIVSAPTLGGMSRVIVEGAGAQAWRPDGKRIGYLVSQYPSSGKITYEFWTCAPDGSDRKCEFADTVVYRPGLRRGFFWSPDGKSVTWVRNFREGYTEIFIHNLENGSERQITFDRKIAEDGIWSPTGYIIYSSNRSGNFNLWTLPVSGGEPEQLTRGSGPDTPCWVSGDGRRLVYSERQQIGQIKIANLEDRSIRQLTVEDRQRGWPCISSTGGAILFPEQEGDALSTTRNIYMVNDQGMDRRKLTDDSTYKAFPFWSPDGKWITYSSRLLNEPTDSARVYLLRVDSPGRPQQIGKGIVGWWFSDSQFVVWSPPNTYLASVARGAYDKLGKDSTFVLPVLKGTSVVMWDPYEGRGGVSVAPLLKGGLTGEARQLLRTNTPSFRIAQKTDELFYTAPPTRELRRISLRDGTDRPVGVKLPGLSVAFDVSGDGKVVAYTDTYFKARFVVIDNLFK